MVTFEGVLPSLLRVCEGSPAAAAVDTWCAVRDLRGRVRLVVKPREASPAGKSFETLEQDLSRELGGYFARPILSTTDQRDPGHLARTVLSLASAWEDAEFDDPVRGAGLKPQGRWLKLERRLSKLDWLESGAPNPPWSLSDPMPAIVTFYSFKGGVGRTTALAACAWQMAAEGRRVAVVDLDLEAPGLGALLEVEAGRGVIDFVVDYLATGAADLTGLFAPAQVFGADAERVQVFPAGRLGPTYLDKLARLDFTASTAWDVGGRPTSPTGDALRALILAIGRQQPRPDAILIDSRAGLHDLSGLSLHGLGHVDMLFSKASEQGYQGMRLAVSLLARRRGGDDLACVVVHSLAPLRGTPESRAEEEEFRARSYAVFRDFVYDESHGYDATSVPPLESAVDPHSPLVLHFENELQRFLSLGERRAVLFGEDYVGLRKRVDELCERESEDDEGAVS